MNTLTAILYGVLIAVGLLDIVLVTPALRAAKERITRGRLLATLATLAGLVVLAGVRLDVPPPPKLLATLALFLIDVGLLGYALFLPTNLMHRSTTHRKERGSAT